MRIYLMSRRGIKGNEKEKTLVFMHQRTREIVILKLTMIAHDVGDK